MDAWLRITLIAASIGIFVVVFLLILMRRFQHPKTRKISVVMDEQRGQSLQDGINRLHQMHLYGDADGSKKPNLYVFRNGVSSKRPVFNWADHPSLITDVVENGWSRFAFTNFVSSLSIKSAKSLFGAFAIGEQENDDVSIEICWEISEGSADYMQKIRLNPGLKRVTSLNSSLGAVSVIRTALPLPGPQVGSPSFPPEAYFEITVPPRNQNSLEYLICNEDDKSEDEKIKLIREDLNSKSEGYLGHVSTVDEQKRNMIEEVKRGKYEVMCLSVGLTVGGSLPLKNPGTYPGSIGFNSSGSVYFDGTKLVLDSDKDDLTRAEKVIGCGYNPNQKKVFFTVDSQLVHEIYCKTEEFGFPLYPTIAANYEIMVLVNLGQSPFKYTPANITRTPNPCFTGPMWRKSPSLCYEDSSELFSIGRVDSQWLLRSTTRSNNNNVTSVKALEYDDQESEGDLFEIVLDSTKKSPYPTHQ